MTSIENPSRNAESNNRNTIITDRDGNVLNEVIDTEHLAALKELAETHPQLLLMCAVASSDFLKLLQRRPSITHLKPYGSVYRDPEIALPAMLQEPADDRRLTPEQSATVFQSLTQRLAIDRTALNKVISVKAADGREIGIITIVLGDKFAAGGDIFFYLTLRTQAESIHRILYADRHVPGFPVLMEQTYMNSTTPANLPGPGVISFNTLMALSAASLQLHQHFPASISPYVPIPEPFDTITLTDAERNSIASLPHDQQKSREAHMLKDKYTRRKIDVVKEILRAELPSLALFEPKMLRDYLTNLQGITDDMADLMAGAYGVELLDRMLGPDYLQNLAIIREFSVFADLNRPEILRSFIEIGTTLTGEPITLHTFWRQLAKNDNVSIQAQIQIRQTLGTLIKDIEGSIAGLPVIGTNNADFAIHDQQKGIQISVTELVHQFRKSYSFIPHLTFRMMVLGLLKAKTRSENPYYDKAIESLQGVESDYYDIPSTEAVRQLAPALYNKIYEQAERQIGIDAQRRLLIELAQHLPGLNDNDIAEQLAQLPPDQVAGLIGGLMQARITEEIKQLGAPSPETEIAPAGGTSHPDRVGNGDSGTADSHNSEAIQNQTGSEPDTHENVLDEFRITVTKLVIKNVLRIGLRGYAMRNPDGFNVPDLITPILSYQKVTTAQMAVLRAFCTTDQFAAIVHSGLIREQLTSIGQHTDHLLDKLFSINGFGNNNPKGVLIVERADLDSKGLDFWLNAITNGYIVVLPDWLEAIKEEINQRMKQQYPQQQIPAWVDKFFVPDNPHTGSIRRVHQVGSTAVSTSISEVTQTQQQLSQFRQETAGNSPTFVVHETGQSINYEGLNSAIYGTAHIYIDYDIYTTRNFNDTWIDTIDELIQKGRLTFIVKRSIYEADNSSFQNFINRDYFKILDDDVFFALVTAQGLQRPQAPVSIQTSPLHNEPSYVQREEYEDDYDGESGGYIMEWIARKWNDIISYFS